jgi:hypothetical protein
MKINAISQDFPLHHEFVNMSPSKPKENKPGIKLFREAKNGYNLEGPDFFRIESNIENKRTKNNRYLDEVITENRSLSLKEIEKNSEQINLIGRIKSNRENSQNPEILKFIKSSNDNNLKNNRIRKTQEGDCEIKINENLATNDNRYQQAFETLKIGYAPKIPHIIINSLSKSNISSPILHSIKNKNSAYLNNLHDYDIKENDIENMEKYIPMIKKEIKSYNCVSDREVLLKPEEIKMKKWDAFYEKYEYKL